MLIWIAIAAIAAAIIAVVMTVEVRLWRRRQSVLYGPRQGPPIEMNRQGIKITIDSGVPGLVEHWDNRWFGTLAPEDVPTNDGRVLAADSLGWRDLPLPLLLGAEQIGHVDDIWRVNGLYRATGLADRDLAGAGLAINIAIGSYDVDGLESSGFMRRDKLRVKVLAGVIGSVNVTDNPAWLQARVDG